MGRGLPPASAIPMSSRQYSLLEKESRKRTSQQQFHTRIEILLRASEGQSNSQLAWDLDVSLNTVKSWRRRWQDHYPKLLEYEKSTA